MRFALLASTLAAALAAASPASAGCLATVGLAPPPEGTAAGQVWVAELTILQHGRTPLADAEPAVTIVNDVTGERRTFAAHATRPDEGRYAAHVVFPSAGRWSYRVFDGFTTMGDEPVPCARTHTFASVEIGAPGAGGNGGAGTAPPWGVVAGLGGLGVLVAAVVALGVRRRRVGSRAPAAA